MAGDESVWWSNTRHMLKAYIKHVEMVKHGASLEEFAVNWCKENGIVRVEVEMKKRLLSELGLQDIGNINGEALAHMFEEQTASRNGAGIFTRSKRLSSGLKLL